MPTAPSSLLGRKLAGKSKRELRDLGLLVDDTGPGNEDGSPHGALETRHG